jgi:hypothetical protein
VAKKKTPKEPQPKGTEYWIGVWGLIISLILGGFVSFWWMWICWSVGFVLFILLVLREWIKNWEEQPRIAVYVTVTTVFIIAAWTSIFASCPLIADIHYRPHPYLDGSTVDGITWSSNSVDVRINLTNPTRYGYEDVDIEISTDLDILGATQVAGVSRVELSPEVDALEAYVTGKDSKGNIGILPNVKPLKRTSSYRLRCDKVARHSIIQLAVKIAKANPSINGQGPQQLYGPRTIPAWVLIHGTYSATGREHDISISKDFQSP